MRDVLVHGPLDEHIDLGARVAVGIARERRQRTHRGRRRWTRYQTSSVLASQKA